jgi:hypothetical protein
VPAVRGASDERICEPGLKLGWFRLDELPVLKPILAERWSGTSFLSTSG